MARSRNRRVRGNTSVAQRKLGLYQTNLRAQKRTGATAAWLSTYKSRQTTYAQGVSAASAQRARRALPALQKNIARLAAQRHLSSADRSKLLAYKGRLHDYLFRAGKQAASPKRADVRTHRQAPPARSAPRRQPAPRKPAAGKPRARPKPGAGQNRNVPGRRHLAAFRQGAGAANTLRLSRGTAPVNTHRNFIKLSTGRLAGSRKGR